jgi:hypothetical protein
MTTEQNLKNIFQSSIDESFDLDYTKIDPIPTASEFQNCLPKAIEPNETLSDGTYSMDIYFAFYKVYGIDSEGNCYVANNYNSIELIFINKIEEYELAIEQAKKDEKDLASWLSHQ